MSDEGEERGKGSKSTTPNSTSTYRYDHEPFETFKSKVLALVNSFGTFEDVNVEHVRGGSYNRVVLARLSTRSGRPDASALERLLGIKLAGLLRRLPLFSKLLRQGDITRHAGVFRIPRKSTVGDGDVETSAGNVDKNNKDSVIESEILDQAAVLQLLAAKEISAPKLLAFDATTTNAIKSPYVFQEYSSGQPLDLVYDSMCVSEKLSIVDALIDVLVSMEAIRFPRIGYIRNSKPQGSSVKWTAFSNSKTPDLPASISGFEIDRYDAVQKMDSYASLSDFMSAQLCAWRDTELAQAEGALTGTWQALCEIFEEMKALGFFSACKRTETDEPNNVLFHWDLEPRNILVKQAPIQSKSTSSAETQDPKATWTIDKIIDWDRVLAVPPVLTRKPPTWLWDFSDDIFRSSRTSIASDYDGDVDLFSPSRYDAESERLSSDDMKIRRHFEDQFTAGLGKIYEGYNKQTYQDEAYGKGRWIRRLARYAIHGISSNLDFTRFDHFDEEWATARTQYTQNGEVGKDGT